MALTIKKALERFTWRFKNTWKPNEEDIKAYNTIATFVKDKHKQQIQDYHLFAKLYVMVYYQFLEKYKTTVFDDIPRKELLKMLDKPLEDFIHRFTDRLNESELYELLDKTKVNDKHPALKTENEKNKEVDNLQEALKDKNNFDKFTGNVWDYETVKENIELQINQVINFIK